MFKIDYLNPISPKGTALWTEDYQTAENITVLIGNDYILGIRGEGSGQGATHVATADKSVFHKEPPKLFCCIIHRNR